MFEARSLFAFLLSLALAGAAHGEFKRYTVQRIEFPDAIAGGAIRINQRGDVVGNYVRSNRVMNGFFFDGQSTIDLGAFQPYDLNNRRQIVGTLLTTNGEYHAVVYHHGTFKDLTPVVGKPNSVALGINAKGDIVGWSADSQIPDPSSPPSFTTAFLIRNGRLTVLNAAFGARAERINNRGDITGVFNSVPGWIRHHQVEDFPQDGAANDLNGLGVVAGVIFQSLVFDGSRAALYRHGTWENLGTLPGDTASFASALNARKQVVGQSYRPGPIGNPFDNTPFLWQKGVMTNLNDLVIDLEGGSIESGIDINNRGWIAAQISDGGPQFPVILRPARKSSASK